jgi:hypothetical protein
MRAFIVGVVLLVCTEANAADTTSANVVLPGCKDQGGSFGVGYCQGVMDGIAFVQDGHFCVPMGVTLRQAMRVVVAYIEARPARMHEDFRKLALEGLREAWPCKR